MQESAIEVTSTDAPSSAPAQSATHYVLIIHGTWNAPEQGVRKWYQSDPGNPDNFCTRLNLRLAKGSLGEAVWRSIGTDGDSSPNIMEFSWSGANDHADRIEAAKKLAGLIKTIVKDDPTARIHFVTHSHGGNVLLKALQFHFDQLELDALPKFRPRARLFGRMNPEKIIKTLKKRSENSDIPLTLAQTDIIDNFTYDKGGWWGRRNRRVAAAWELKNDWLMSPDTHHIGRIVNLGTPFYYKNWQTPGWTRRFIGWIQRLGRKHIYWGAAILFIVIAVSFALDPKISPQISRENLVETIGFLLGAGFAFGIGVAFIIGYFALLAYPAIRAKIYFDNAYRDANIYFTPLQSFREADVKDASKPPPEKQIDILNISCGYLDEALLALSSEPIAHALLVPAIDNVVKPPLWRPVSLLTAGVNPEARWLNRSSMVNRFFTNLFLLVPNFFSRYVLSWPLRRYMTNQLLLIASSSSYGLNARDYKDADISVQKNMTDGSSFFNVTFHDAEKQIAERPLIVDVETKKGDFDYLWDDASLNDRLARSIIWPRLNEQMAAISKRYRKSSKGERYKDEAALQRLCVTIDERLKMFSGALEVLHSSYYMEPAIIAGIANFLDSGEIGEELAGRSEPTVSTS